MVGGNNRGRGRRHRGLYVRDSDGHSKMEEGMEERKNNGQEKCFVPYTIEMTIITK